ncbi:MAG: hypothetical protein A2X28_09885 [Elusimicrobia bacterium GWA2_56_46]|nr:MAG: hypothetical protein A2X28_09885 [Elusimicrobia bacterium GWA2_56_46]OGR56274.1 MAG: hypothetical protein A2X39_01705 [Elusimicrobia bacterium GWC2_56_31]HBB67540.1 hypothetical protein [Elusimicrobiota bacterium]HBW22464.1 hypothetical protein [Elusimicrobiota bacterium]
MFLFKKLLTPFFLPPGIFAALALGAAVLLFRKNRKQALAWAAFGALIWAASIKPVGDLALAGLEYAYLPPAEIKADAVVVLTGGVRESVPGLFGESALSSVSLERAVEAAGLYRRFKFPIVVTGGAVFSKGSEAAAVKTYLAGLGVPREKIFTEDRARDTGENAVFSKRICDGRGYKKIILLTSAYHMRRAVRSFENAGFGEIVPYPAAYKTSRSPRYYYVDFLPGCWENLRLAAHEYLGLIFYRLRA